jgi:hypothetical protein
MQKYSWGYFLQPFASKRDTRDFLKVLQSNTFKKSLDFYCIVKT